MFKQTLCTTFEIYGDVFSSFNENIYKTSCITKLSLKDKSAKYLFVCNSDIYIRIKKGVILILVSKDSKFENIQSYIMNAKIKLNKGTFYNFIPISDGCELDIYGDNPFKESILLNKPYTYNEIIPNIKIEKIYTKFYQEKSTNYLFKGEKHYFWELTFVDRGVLYTNIDGIDYKLKQGELIFYAPNQYHTQYTDSKKSCSYLTLTFSMDFNDLSLLSNRVFSSSKDIYSIVSKLVKELKSDNIYSSEFILCYLKLLILKVLTIDFENTIIKPVSNVQQNFDNKLLEEILTFINNNIYEHIDIQKLCTKFGISNSKLHLLFKSNLNDTAKNYINTVKLEKSKDLIKESNYTISYISEILGFTSVHYFSKKFKKTYGFSPREYLKSVNKNY